MRELFSILPVVVVTQIYRCVKIHGMDTKKKKLKEMRVREVNLPKAQTLSGALLEPNLTRCDWEVSLSGPAFD